MEFRDKFKSYSNTKLLSIIDNPLDYQLQAVEIAKELFAERNISEEEIQSAKACLENAKSLKSIDEVNLNLIQKYLFNKGKLQANNSMHTKWMLKTLSIALWSIFIVLLSINVALIIIENMNQTEEIEFMIYFVFPPLLLIPLSYIIPILGLLAANILFYKRTKIGYVLVAVFLMYCSVYTIENFANTRSYNLTALSITSSILCLLLFGGLLWLLCKQQIRTVYSVSLQEMYATLFVASLICLVL